MTPRSLFLLCTVPLIGPTAWPASAAAQAAPTATLRVRVVDEMTGDAVDGAVVRLKGRPDTSTTTDPSGQVELAGLEPGTWKMDIRAVGFEPRFESVRLTAGQVYQRSFGLTFTGEKLPDVVVEARRDKLVPRYADFYRRRQNRLGYYLTWEEIKSRGYSSLGNALQYVRGVYVKCQIHDCRITMSRSHTCEPAYWVDGIEGKAFATTIPIRDIYGLEVYRGSGEMPGEYAGSGGCGAIVIWTKNKPFR
jgi:Carboxypeptidase regulatory-like domain